MSGTELSCSHCGAGIAVPPSARFAACSHCGAQLAIHHTPAASYTEVLQQVRTRAAGAAEELERARLQHELEKIELAWQMRQRSLVGGPEMTRSAGPEPGQIPAGLAIVSILAALVIIMGFGVLGGSAGWVFGPLIVLALLGAAAFLRTLNATPRKSGPQLTYERERAEIVRRLEALQSGAAETTGARAVAGWEPQAVDRSPVDFPGASAPPAERVTVEALTTACAECGAPVTVAPGAQVASCGHCGARLAVHRTPSACYTEVIERIREYAQQAQANIEILRLQSALEELEMRWKVQRDRMMIRGQGGQNYPPTRPGALLGVLSGLAAFGMGVSAALTHQWLTAMFGLFILVSALAHYGKAIDAARRFEAAEQNYRLERAELMAKLNSRQS